MLIVTTHVTIKRPAGAGDPYEAVSAPTIASGVAAHISAPTGTEANVGGAQERIDAVLLAPCGTNLQRADIVVDALTGRSYRVGTVAQRTGLGLNHARATLVSVVGGANG